VCVCVCMCLCVVRCGVNSNIILNINLHHLFVHMLVYNKHVLFNMNGMNIKVSFEGFFMHKYFEIKYSRKFSSKHNLTGSGLPKAITVSCASLLPYFLLMVQMRQIFILFFQFVCW
jgi:hypothetical protein